MSLKRKVHFLIIVFCIAFWFSASIVINPYSPFTTIVYKHFLLGKSENTARGFFTAEENNLGIVALKIEGNDQEHNKTQELINFSLKEEGVLPTLYSSSNKIEQVNEKGFLVFGFPSISQSKGKQYEFVVSAPNTLHEESYFISKYIYTKQSLHSVKDISSFFIKRVKMLFFNTDALLFSSVYLMPLLFYIFYARFKKKKPELGKKILIILQNVLQKVMKKMVLLKRGKKRVSKEKTYTITKNEEISILSKINNKYLRALSLHLLFLLFSIIVLMPILLDPHVVKANDLNGTDVYQIYFRTAVRTYHSLPQWNPYMQQGLPLVADPMQGMYNPIISIPIIFMPSYDSAIKLIYIVSLFLACECMYLLTKEFTKSSKISFFIASMFATSGYAGARLVAGHIESFVSYCILPFLIFSLYKIIAKKNFLWSGIVALSFTYILFSGSVYFLLYGFYCVLGLLLYYFFKDRKAFFFLCLSLFLFVLFSSIKIFPILELQNSLGKTKEPFLGSQTLISIIRYLFIPSPIPFQILRLEAFLTPAWAEMEKIAFIGFFPFLGLLWLIKNFRKIQLPQKSFLVILFIVCFLIVMPGWEINPFHWLIERVTALQFFRVPSRAFAFLIVIILLLFGIFLRFLTDNKKVKKLVLPMLIVNLISTIIFFEVLLIKPEIIAYPVLPANIALYNNIFSWLEQHNTDNSYVMAEISPNEVPEDIAFYHRQRLLNTNYGFILKNSPAAHFADITRPTPVSYAYNYTDIQPGYFISPHNLVEDIPSFAKKVYQTGDTSIYQLPNGKPFAVVEDGDGTSTVVYALFGLNSFYVKAAATSNKHLSLSEMNYPGWSVTIDGKKAQLEKSRFLEVKTVPGEHTYVFSFVSKPFFFGLLFSGLSLGGFLLWLGITFFLKRSVFVSYL